MITGVASAGTSYRSGSCPSGLNSCDASVGGGCCLNGFGCGTAICTASAAGSTGTVPKVAPNGASNARIEFMGWLWMSVGALLGLVMVVL